MYRLNVETKNTVTQYRNNIIYMSDQSSVKSKPNRLQNTAFPATENRYVGRTGRSNTHTPLVPTDTFILLYFARQYIAPLLYYIISEQIDDVSR